MSPEIQTAANTLRRLPMDLLTTYELSIYLRCCRKSIERMVTSGLLTPIRIGRNFRFNRADVIDILTRAA